MLDSTARSSVATSSAALRADPPRYSLQRCIGIAASRPIERREGTGIGVGDRTTGGGFHRATVSLTVGQPLEHLQQLRRRSRRLVEDRRRVGTGGGAKDRVRSLSEQEQTGEQPHHAQQHRKEALQSSQFDHGATTSIRVPSTSTASTSPESAAVTISARPSRSSAVTSPSGRRHGHQSPIRHEPAQPGQDRTDRQHDRRPIAIRDSTRTRRKIEHIGDELELERLRRHAVDDGRQLDHTRNGRRLDHELGATVDRHRRERTGSTRPIHGDRHGGSVEQHVAVPIGEQLRRHAHEHASVGPKRLVGCQQLDGSRWTGHLEHLDLGARRPVDADSNRGATGQRSREHADTGEQMSGLGVDQVDRAVRPSNVQPDRGAVGDRVAETIHGDRRHHGPVRPVGDHRPRAGERHDAIDGAARHDVHRGTGAGGTGDGEHGEPTADGRQVCWYLEDAVFHRGVDASHPPGAPHVSGEPIEVRCRRR